MHKMNLKQPAYSTRAYTIITRNRFRRSERNKGNQEEEREIVKWEDKGTDYEEEEAERKEIQPTETEEREEKEEKRRVRN